MIMDPLQEAEREIEAAPTQKKADSNIDSLQEAEREIEAAPTSIKKTFELTNPNEATIEAEKRVEVAPQILSSPISTQDFKKLQESSNILEADIEQFEKQKTIAQKEAELLSEQRQKIQDTEVAEFKQGQELLPEINREIAETNEIFDDLNARYIEIENETNELNKQYQIVKDYEKRYNEAVQLDPDQDAGLWTVYSNEYEKYETMYNELSGDIEEYNEDLETGNVKLENAQLLEKQFQIFEDENLSYIERQLDPIDKRQKKLEGFFNELNEESNELNERSEDLNLLLQQKIIDEPKKLDESIASPDFLQQTEETRQRFFTGDLANRELSDLQKETLNIYAQEIREPSPKFAIDTDIQQQEEEAERNKLKSNDYKQEFKNFINTDIRNATAPQLAKTTGNVIWDIFLEEIVEEAKKFSPNNFNYVNLDPGFLAPNPYTKSTSVFGEGDKTDLDVLLQYPPNINDVYEQVKKVTQDPNNPTNYILSPQRTLPDAEIERLPAAKWFMRSLENDLYIEKAQEEGRSINPNSDNFDPKLLGAIAEEKFRYADFAIMAAEIGFLKGLGSATVKASAKTLNNLYKGAAATPTALKELPNYIKDSRIVLSKINTLNPEDLARRIELDDALAKSKQNNKINQIQNNIERNFVNVDNTTSNVAIDLKTYNKLKSELLETLNNRPTILNDFVNKYRSATPTSINGQAANILRNKLNVPAQTTIAESKAITKAMDDLEKAKQLKDNEIVIEKLYPQLKDQPELQELAKGLTKETNIITSLYKKGSIGAAKLNPKFEEDMIAKAMREFEASVYYGRELTKQMITDPKTGNYGVNVIGNAVKKLVDDIGEAKAKKIYQLDNVILKNKQINTEALNKWADNFWVKHRNRNNFLNSQGAKNPFNRKPNTPIVSPNADALASFETGTLAPNIGDKPGLKKPEETGGNVTVKTSPQDGPNKFDISGFQKGQNDLQNKKFAAASLKNELNLNSSIAANDLTFTNQFGAFSPGQGSGQGQGTGQGQGSGQAGGLGSAFDSSASDNTSTDPLSGSGKGSKGGKAGKTTGPGKTGKGGKGAKKSTGTGKTGKGAKGVKGLAAKKPKIKKRIFTDLSEPDPSYLMDVDKKEVSKKRYPKKVQWYNDKKNKYVTLDLNSGQRKEHVNVQPGGIKPGKSPKDTIKVIRTQNKRPKILNARLGSIQIVVRSPQVVTARRIKNLDNFNARKYSFKK